MIIGISGNNKAGKLKLSKYTKYTNAVYIITFLCILLLHFRSQLYIMYKING